MSTSKLIETINSEIFLKKLDEIDLDLNKIEVSIKNALDESVNIETSPDKCDKAKRDKINVAVTSKPDKAFDKELLSEELSNLGMTVSSKSDEKVDRELLSEEFDEMDIETNYKYNSKYSYDEVSPNDDPADLVDIFPNLLGNENRYYPKFWY